MKKRLALLVFILILSLAVFAACGNDANSKSSESKENLSKDKVTEEKTVIRIAAPKAPPVLPVLKMMQDKALGENVEIKLEFWETPEQLIAMVQGNDSDMYAFPLTVIAKLYNKGMGVKLTNVNTFGVSYFMSSDDSVKTWADLKGKTIYVPLQSSPPDVMTQFFLNEAGLTKDDYKIVYASKTELAQLMMSGKAKYGTMIEPLVSAVKMKNPDMKVVMSFEKEWQKVKNTDKKIPNAGFGASASFADKHHELVVKFEKEYEKATKWINENLDKAGEMAESKLGMKKAIIVKAIPNMGLEYKSASDSKAELDDFYQLLFDFNPSTIGGKIPDEKMYFE